MRGGRPDVAERHAKNRAKRPETVKKAPQTPDIQAFESVENADPENFRGSPSGVEDALAHYKAQALKFRNNLTRLELALSRGEWLEREAHTRSCGELGKRLRQGLENLADSLAPRMAAGLVDNAAIEAEIRQTIEEVLGA